MENKKFQDGRHFQNYETWYINQIKSNQIKFIVIKQITVCDTYIYKINNNYNQHLMMISRVPCPQFHRPFNKGPQVNYLLSICWV